MKSGRKKPQVGFALAVLGINLLILLRNSLAIAYSIKEPLKQLKRPFLNGSVSATAIIEEDVRQLQTFRPRSAILGHPNAHYHAKRDLSEYNQRGWKLIEGRENNADSHLGQPDAAVTAGERYFKPKLQQNFPCPDTIQVFLSLFNMEKLAQTEGQLDTSYIYFIFNSKVKELMGSWAEIYVSIDKRHMIITWWYDSSDIGKIFEKDYDFVMLTTWFSTVRAASRRAAINIKAYPPTYITIAGVKSEETLEALEEIKVHLGSNINELGGYSIERPENLNQDNFVAQIWASLIGVPEISAIEQMLARWSTLFPPRYQIQSICFNIHTVLLGDREAIVSVTLRQKEDTPDYDTADSLTEATETMTLDDDKELRNYPGIEIFEGSTLELLAPGPVTGSKRKPELAPPTYSTIKWLLLTTLGDVKNSEIRVSTSGPESHLVLLDGIGTEKQQIVADFIYLSWMKAQGAQDLRDITFLQLTPNTEALIRKVVEELGVEISKQSPLILWGRGHWRRAFREESTAEPSSQRRLHDNLLRKFAQTEYGAVLKMILQQQRYDGISPGFELRSLEIGDGTNVKKSKGKGREDGTKSITTFAMLVRLERAQYIDVPEDQLSIAGAPLSAEPLHDDGDGIDIGAESPISLSGLEVLNTVAIRGEIPDQTIERKIANHLQEVSQDKEQTETSKLVFTFVPDINTLSNIHKETRLLVQRFGELERKGGKPPLPHLNAIAASGQEPKPHYYRFSLSSRYKGPHNDPNLDLGEFYFSPSTNHLVIAMLPTSASIGHLSHFKLLYSMISELCESYLQLEGANRPRIQFISFESLDERTQDSVADLFDMYNVDKSANYLKFSLIDIMLAEYIPEFVQSSKPHRLGTERKVLSAQERIVGNLLRTRELSAIHDMVVTYYGGQYVGDRILDNIFITWRKGSKGSLVPQILAVLRDVPEKLKHSDMAEWIRIISSAVGKLAPKPKPTPTPVPVVNLIEEWSAVVVGQALIARTNQDINVLNRQRGLVSTSRSSRTETPPRARFENVDWSHEQVRTTFSSGDLLEASLGLATDLDFNMASYKNVDRTKRIWVFMHPNLKQNRDWTKTKLKDLPGYVIVTYLVRRVLVLLDVDRTILSQEQQQAELMQMYERSWFGQSNGGIEPPAPRIILISNAARSSINIVEEILSLRKQSCKDKDAPGRIVTIMKPEPHSQKATGFNRFMMNTDDTRDTLEWATLIGIPEISALVELGLKWRMTKDTWFFPLGVAIQCTVKNSPSPTHSGSPLLRIGLRLAHYSSSTGAEIAPN
ncbi:hypothetical protein TWF506_009257 [Arthrobotrys conoides]|uniref:Uncharacterized protein n=1 Tax=Arthrobotrys conoides TaxID=74498 RepID=A0AAN8NI89_9PEZI